MPTRRRSPKREAILQHLRTRCDHPTAQQVYAALRTEIPSLSLGTVYRNLNLLAEEGAVLALTADGETRFDGCVRPHYHLHCLGCGKLSDVFDSTAERFLCGVQQSQSCKIQSAELMVNCLCRDCVEYHNA